MDTDSLVIYETWNTPPLALPPRSRLFHLAPIGVGTPDVESLTSYVARLAEAHRVQPRHLVVGEILPLLGRPRLSQTPFPSLATIFRNSTHAHNGMGTQARDLVRSLATLTGRSDLHFLTLLPWAEVLSVQQLHRRTRAYCPACFEEWQQAGQVVYELLLWTLAPVIVCPRHRQRLRLTCPYPDCHSAAPWLSARSRPGYCARCERWQGSADGEEGSGGDALTTEEFTAHAWIVDALGELLAAAPSLPALPRREQLLRTLVSWMRSQRTGSRQAQARQLGVSDTAIRYWERGAAVPSLWLLLRVCYHLGTSPLRILTGAEADPPPADLQPPVARYFPLRPVRARTAFDREALRQALEDILSSTEEPPPSLREVARRLGRPDEVLRRQLPELCHAIAERYLRAQRAQGLRRRQRLRDEVRQATYQVHAQGQYPSAHRVAQLVSQPGSLRGGVAKVAWQEALAELG